MNVVFNHVAETSARALETAPLRVDTIKASQLTTEHVDAWHQFTTSALSLQSPFYAPEFIRAVARVKSDVYVGVFTRAGKIQGFLPYQFATPWHRIFGIAERVGQEMSDYFGVIGRADFNLTPERLLKLCRLNALSFTHLDETQKHFGLSGTQPEIGLRISLDGGAAAYWARLIQHDKRFINDTERRERKLVASHGALRFEFTAINTTDELNRLLHAKRTQYVRTNAQDALHESWKNELLLQLANTSSEHCRGQLSVLFSGDTWVASHFGLRKGHVLHYWFPAYNPDLKAFSPGRLLLKSIINAADDAHITLIDRGSGDTVAKREFANETHQYSRDTWYVPGLVSTCYRAAQSIAWRLAPR